jgi:hypothetical protein
MIAATISVKDKQQQQQQQQRNGFITERVALTLNVPSMLLYWLQHYMLCKTSLSTSRHAH